VTLAAVVAVLAVANVASNRLVPAVLYVPWNLAVTAALVVVARRRMTDTELGLTEWRRGGVFGAVLVVATLGTMLLALAMPAFRQLYEDRRVDDDLVVVLYQAFVRVPFGTVLLEEIAFRSVLPALATLRQHTGLPHSIVLDEAHYFLHAQDGPRLLDLELNTYTLVSYRASRLHRDILAATEVIIVTRESDPHEVRALKWLERFGPKACLLAWLPGVGDPLCAVAGWLKMPFWPCLGYMAIGKFARYVTMTAALLWVFPGAISV